MLFLSLSRFLEIFHSNTTNQLEFEKNAPKCPPFLWFLSLKDPQYFALHALVSGGCCSLKHSQKLENFVILKQNRAICEYFRCKFNKDDEIGVNLIKVMKTRFQFYRLNRPNCAWWKNFIWRAAMIDRASHWSNTKGDILQPPAIWFCTS